jgi:hypothetical protein
MVSDAQLGPGWWQAADGKWYPPQQRRRTQAWPIILCVLAALIAAGVVGYELGDSRGSTASSTKCSTLAKGGPTHATGDFACQDGSHFYIAASYRCKDGRTLAWSDFAWGYVGEPAHIFPSGDRLNLTPPEAETRACLN